LSIKRNIPRRRTYNLALPPVAEYLDDEQSGDELNWLIFIFSFYPIHTKNKLKNISGLHNNNFNENSLTF